MILKSGHGSIHSLHMREAAGQRDRKDGLRRRKQFSIDYLGEVKDNRADIP